MLGATAPPLNVIGKKARFSPPEAHTVDRGMRRQVCGLAAEAVGGNLTFG